MRLWTDPPPAGLPTEAPAYIGGNCGSATLDLGPIEWTSVWMDGSDEPVVSLPGRHRPEDLALLALEMLQRRS